MESIVPKHGVVKCLNCTNLIGSYSPVCSKCGLPTSEAGVIELAEIDEHNRLALTHAEDLFYYSGTALLYTFVAFLIGVFIPAASFSLILVSGIALVLFWWKCVSWGWRYDQNRFPDEVFAEAVNTRRRAIIVGIVFTSILLAVMYWVIREPIVTLEYLWQ